MLADENRINIRLHRAAARPDPRSLRRRARRRTARPIASSWSPSRPATSPRRSTRSATLVPLSEADRRRVLRDVRRKHSFVPVVIRENLSWDEMARIEVNTLELPGVSIEQGLTRNYPFGDDRLACRRLCRRGVGAGSDGDDPLLELPDFRIGKSGVEKAVRSRAARHRRHQPGRGQRLWPGGARAGARRRHGRAGHRRSASTWRCRISPRSAAPREESAACVLLDAWTGEVLAMVSSPGYDPARSPPASRRRMWQELIDRSAATRCPTRRSAGTYAPGSTFKPMVALAALEAGVITPETRVQLPRLFRARQRRRSIAGSMAGTARCAARRDQEFLRRLLLSRRRAASASTASRRWRNRFGFGVALGIDMPGETAGPDPDPRLEAGDHRRRLAAGRDDQLPASARASSRRRRCSSRSMVARLVTGRAVVPRLVREQG